MNYQKAYALLLGSMSNAIDELNKSTILSVEMENAVKILKEALETAEEMYLEAY